MRVAGADIAAGSWLVVWIEDGSILGHELVETLVGRLGAASAVAVDVPLDLPTTRIGRPAEDEARRLLGPRSSTIFPSLPLELYEGEYSAASREEARARYGRAFSKQAWNLRGAVLDARAARTDTWVETHPELAFMQLAGEPLPPKRTWEGVRRRLDGLESAGLSIPPFAGPLATASIMALPV